MDLTAVDYYKEYFSENYKLIKDEKGKPIFRFETVMEFAEMYSRKQLLIHGVASAFYDNRTQEEKDMKRMWDEGETVR